MSIVFDIETKPRPDLVQRFIKPFPPFDPLEVKYGNTKKDEVKRALIFSEAQQAHVEKESDYWKNAHDKAALNPLTAEICAIGLRFGNETLILGADGATEAIILRQFWEAFQNNHGEPFVFWSGNGGSTENFDPDFIIKRSWICGVEVAPGAFDGRYLGRKFVDAASRYLLFKREAYCSLTDAADQLGLYGGENPTIKPKVKDAIITGKDFHLWWDGKGPGTNGLIPADEQRAMAIGYLTNDLLTAELIAARIL